MELKVVEAVIEGGIPCRWHTITKVFGDIPVNFQVVHLCHNRNCGRSWRPARSGIDSPASSGHALGLPISGPPVHGDDEGRLCGILGCQPGSPDDELTPLPAPALLVAHHATAAAAEQAVDLALTRGFFTHVH